MTIFARAWCAWATLASVAALASCAEDPSRQRAAQPQVSHTAQAEVQPRFSAALPVLVKAAKAHRADRFEEAANFFHQGLTGAVRSPGLFEVAACAATTAGRRDEAFTYLERMVSLGVPDPTAFSEDPDLAVLHADPRWAPLVARARANAKDGHNPDQFQVVTEDVARFWQAYDEAVRATDPAEVFNRRYIDVASPALQFFLVAKVESVDDLVRRSLRERPRYYASVRANTMRLGENLPRFRSAFRRLHDLLPEVTFADMTFVVGRMQSAGTASIEGLIFGSEQLARDSSTPLDELDVPSVQMTNLADNLVPIVVHESMHFQQRFGPDRTLLAGVLREGGPDLLAEIVTGRNPNAAIRAYGDAHERELWAEFRRAMDGTDASEWIANKKPPPGDRPRDLGYYIGYRITKSYYDRASDKTAAMRAILSVKDPKAFLATSGYSP